ncbi:hypothetical protein CXB51_002800 [Gossypium anomalum]|uniref:RNase H type-1 domain-containing protein n=1 Tax=Gossypium anomalum TaxID=47600 RepID=A0A8J5Z4Y4_9ROSI|nr:hypothetical protein CXB51_002800 [Gossypium anomalum]
MKEFYKKLWGLELPPKIAITIWRISWDFIPNFVNLRYRRIISNDRCPRCCSWEEDSLHIFRDCPATTEVWRLVHLPWVVNNMNQSLWEWLTWVLKREYEAVREIKRPVIMTKFFRAQEEVPRTTVYFDAAFDSSSSTSATGLVIWDLTENLLAVKSIIHNNIPSPFVAEAHACLEGLKLGISLGLQSIKIMGDSKTVIKKCQANLPDKSVLGAIINDIHNKKGVFKRLFFNTRTDRRTHKHIDSQKILLLEGGLLT